MEEENGKLERIDLDLIYSGGRFLLQGLHFKSSIPGISGVFGK